MEELHGIATIKLYARINNELTWHKFSVIKDINDCYLRFTTSHINGDFILARGTHEEVGKIYNREVFITTNSGFRPHADNLVNQDIQMNIPMKALPFGKGKTTFPCYYQPKINGGRCISELVNDNDEGFIVYGKHVKLTSKEGHNLPVEHIINQLKPIYDMFGSPILDGEIYHYGKECTTINGAARNVKNPIHDKLAFVIFDIILYGVSQFVRTTILNQIAHDSMFNAEILHLNNNDTAIGKVFFLDTDIVEREDSARLLAEEHILNGYEGIILRNPEAVYQQGKHVGNLTKIKKQLEGMFRIFDIISKPTLEDQPLFVIVNDTTDETLPINPVGKHEDLKKYLINRKDYIGKMVKVTYYERTINGLPFHANVYPEIMEDYVEEKIEDINECNIDDL